MAATRTRRTASPEQCKPKAGALAEATISEGDGIRCLHLGTEWIQGAMRIAKPQAIELEYVQRMMVWMLWRASSDIAAGHAVQLGLGVGAITRYCHQVLRMHTTAVENNASVIAANRMWFHLPANDQRLTVTEVDAGAWLRDAEPQSAQVLCVDLYDHEAAAPVLDDEQFYADCRRLLDHGGLMTVNLFGRDASFAASAARIAAVFGATQVWRVRPTREGNTVVVAARGVEPPDRDGLLARAAHIESRFRLPARKWLRLIGPLPADVTVDIAADGAAWAPD